MMLVLQIAFGIILGWFVIQNFDSFLALLKGILLLSVIIVLLFLGYITISDGLEYFANNCCFNRCNFLLVV